MKRKLAIALVVVLSMTSIIIGCGKKDNEGKTNDPVVKSEDQSADRKTFIVGFDAEYPPYGYMDDKGEYVGFDLEAAQLVCDELGWVLEKKPISWDSKDMELKSGAIDCIWNGFSITPERESQYTWSSPYVNNTQVMLVKSDSGIQTLADLSGKDVVVQAASAALEALRSDNSKELTDGFASLTENPDYNTAFMNLESGAAQAVAIDIGVAEYQIAQRTEDAYAIIEEPFFTEQYGIGFRLEDKALRDKVEETLLKLVESGEYEKLAKKYGIDPETLCLGK